MRALTATLVTMLLLPASAAAKSGISLTPAPNVNAGQKWQVTLLAIRNDGPTSLPPGAHPAVQIAQQGTGQRLTFPARPRPGGSWLASVVFPSPGTWTYRVTGTGSLGAAQHWQPVRILRSTAAAGTPGPPINGSGFPFGWVAAISPIAIALGLWYERRRSSRRSEPAPPAQGR